MVRSLIAALVLFLSLAPAAAQTVERRVMLSAFDRVRVDGPFEVRVTTGQGAGALVQGDARAIDAISVRVEGRTLIVSQGPNGWGGWPGDRKAQPQVIVTTPELRAAAVNGAGRVTIDRVGGQRVDLTITGPGSLTVARIDADQLVVSLTGAGMMTLAGEAGRARVVSNGSGTIAATGLVARDLIVVAQSAGETAVGARYTADVTATGLGIVRVGGVPKCTTRGPGQVLCGAGE